MAKNTSVIGIYTDRTTVSDAIDVLHKEGYRAADISVLSSDNQGSKDFGHEKHTKAAEGAAVGAAIGAVIGAALAWLVSIQTVAIPVLAPLAAAGPVLAALAGAGAGGALGWIAGLLAGLPLSEYVAKRYAGRIRRGGILLSVHCDGPEWRKRAKKTLKTLARGISPPLRNPPPTSGRRISRRRGPRGSSRIAATRRPEPVECATPETRNRRPLPC